MKHPLRLLFIVILQTAPLFGYSWNGDSILRTWNGDKSELLSIIENAKLNNDTKCLANAYRRLGTLYKNQGQLDSAADYYVSALKIAEKRNDTLSVASCYNQLGVTYLGLNKYPEAFNYFSKAYDAYALFPDYRGMSDAILNEAEIRFYSGMPDEAKSLCLQSMEYRRQWGDTSDMGYNYDLLSRVYEKQGKRSECRCSQRIAIKLFRIKNDYSGLLPALLNQGETFYYTNNPDSAKACYSEVWKLSRKLGRKNLAQTAANKLVKIYEKRQQIDSAFYYLQMYAAYADTLHNESMLRSTLDIAEKYRAEKKDIEIMHQQKLSEDRLSLIIAMSILVLLLIFTIAILIRNRGQRRKIAQKESDLKSANAMLQGQDTERERIARELHDRVGSMLSTVKLHFSSMEEQMKDWLKYQGASYNKALELLDETYEEVRRISHDLDSGLLSRFGLGTAMLQLAQIIESTNKLKVTYIDNNVASELYKAYETDLYRITQELLSNTIKHANATEVSIQLSHSNGNLIYSYEDDGKGFVKDFFERSPGIGFKNVRTRIDRMKGVVHFESSPGHGFNLIIELPLHETNKNSDRG
jgi:two-component system NarL family sensor kinase